MNIHCTGSQVDDNGTITNLGSIAVVLSPGSRWALWRFLDDPPDRIEAARLRDTYRLA